MELQFDTWTTADWPGMASDLGGTAGPLCANARSQNKDPEWVRGPCGLYLQLLPMLTVAALHVNGGYFK